MTPMKLYLLTSSEYHDNPRGFGIFSSLEKAEAAVMQTPTAGVIHVIELDKLYREEGNTHIKPSMQGMVTVECGETNFQIG